MKKLWKMRKDGEGVSPVIATILMVAITVVLAAVLYVMVLGIGGDTTGNIIISVSESSSATNYTVSVVAIQGTNQLATSDVMVLVIDDNSVIGLQSRLLSGMTSGTAYNDVTFFETSAAGGYLNSGDYFVLSKSTYGIGSVLKLTDAAGQQTYLSWTIG